MCYECEGIEVYEDDLETFERNQVANDNEEVEEAEDGEFDDEEVDE
jgi:hypothetical protein